MHLDPAGAGRQQLPEPLGAGRPAERDGEHRSAERDGEHRSAERTVSRRPAGSAETARANRTWWDSHAEDYYAEHGSFLGDCDLIWGPERVREADLRLLGELAGRDVLEVGSGAAQGARYVAGCGARVVASDLSAGMLRQARRIARAAAHAGDRTVPQVPLVQCDATLLPFADASFDVVFTSYGAVPFVADSAALMRECARVLRPGGRFVFATSHPIRWAFPDVPDEAGLTVRASYFDRTPYVEAGPRLAEYVEHHRTLGDRVREIVAAGLELLDVVEPEWPESTTQIWGGWSPLRGRLIPGTAVFVTRRPAHGVSAQRPARSGPPRHSPQAGRPAAPPPPSAT